MGNNKGFIYGGIGILSLGVIAYVLYNNKNKVNKKIVTGIKPNEVINSNNKIYPKCF
jgi:hypothetical protein